MNVFSSLFHSICERVKLDLTWILTSLSLFGLNIFLFTENIQQIRTGHGNIMTKPMLSLFPGTRAFRWNDSWYKYLPIYHCLQVPENWVKCLRSRRLAVLDGAIYQHICEGESQILLARSYNKVAKPWSRLSIKVILKHDKQVVRWVSWSASYMTNRLSGKCQHHFLNMAKQHLENCHGNI